MARDRTSNLYQGVPLERRRAVRREALIRAAIAVYGERGYRAATVRSVCTAAVDRVSGAALKAFGLLLDAAVNGAEAREPSPALLRAGVTGGIIPVALRWIAGGYVQPIDAVVEQAARLCGTLMQAGI